MVKLRPIEEIIKDLTEKANLRGSCKASGHTDPSQGKYPEIILNPYNHKKSKVTVICSNCGYIYQRSSTDKEREDYKKLMNSELS